MTEAALQEREAILERIRRQFESDLPADTAQRAAVLARCLYRRVPVDELAERPLEDLCGLVVGFLGFAVERQPGRPIVRVFNPERAEHGWESTHTVVEIVNDDMPFLVDSVTMAIANRDFSVHLILHPLIRVEREPDGTCLALHEDTGEEAGRVESFMHFEIDRQTEKSVLNRLREDIEWALADVRVAVEDWKQMRGKALEVCADIGKDRSPVAGERLDEACSFLEWLADDHFTFLGYREYEVVQEKDRQLLRAVPGTGLGLLRSPEDKNSRRPIDEIERAVRLLERDPEALIITKTNARATVHRQGYMDYIGVLAYDAKGYPMAEQRFLGLFTSAAYTRRPWDIPLVRGKVESVMERSGFRRDSHAGKALAHILETLPRDELFQASIDELYDLALGILNLQERLRTRLFIRRDRFGRFFSCLVYIPRERFNTEVRERIQGILMRALRGKRVDYNVQIAESVLARLYLVIRPKPGEDIEPDVEAVEEKLVRAVRSWSDGLREALVKRLGEEHGIKLANRYGAAFPAAYMEDVPGWVASFDVENLDRLRDRDDLALSLYKPRRRGSGILRFKIFRHGSTIPLSHALPMLENMGLHIVSERPYEVSLKDGTRLWIQDFDMIPVSAEGLDLDKVRRPFQQAFAGIYAGTIENDGFNRLILAARLNWRQVSVLRGYCKYLLQAGVPFSQNYMERTLAEHPDIARALLELFEARFDPSRSQDRDKEQARRVREIDTALERVRSLDEDRILRAYRDLILATLRTNHFQQRGGQREGCLAIKLQPARVPHLPKPRPAFEVFVCSPRLEAVHLRGGAVARGGLRWSDRREDFRTEILGLMKAQTVKNTMIVPVGAKGGFVIKRPPPEEDRDAVKQEVLECYRSFIHSLLDLTDNLRGDGVAHPERVVRHDREDDPYLVVAADKGTATFSDTANEVAAGHDFWLGDAFASGGSNGYDHKKMGITARGAWESVKRHFRELGKDIQNEPFTVVGIGDMGGDVFGNGMLLSRQIRLQAAFNHRHIFLDPDPDPERSYAERERLFNTPGTGWGDYDTDLISRGGSVFDRSEKIIAVSPQVAEWLGVEDTQLTPQELIREILKAPAELLWNGGIGTYVKASSESDADVGDRANDALRVNGSQLRCKVIGEGGNLGLTQRGRIEFALNGGRINTDFIDNSGGVDCSDHEVNIKILFNDVIAAGKLEMEARNRLLERMTDEVAGLVLRNNYLQTQAISMMEAQADQRAGEYGHFIRVLERRGTLDRELEHLPEDEELRERRALGRGMTRPELSLLLSYSKMSVYADLLDSDVPEDPYLARELVRYFPVPMQEGYSDFMEQHRLRREIIATAVTNSMVNRMGAAFALRLREDTGASAAEVAKAYTIAREVFDARSIWEQIESLDNRVEASVQIEMILRVWRLLRHASRWLLNRRKHEIGIAEAVHAYGTGIGRLTKMFDRVISVPERESFARIPDRLGESGVPRELAVRIGALNALYPGLDIVDVANACDLPVDNVARVYYQLGESLSLQWLRTQVEQLPVDRQWHAQARGAIRDELYRRHRVLTSEVLRQYGARDISDPVAEWMSEHDQEIDHVRRMFADMRALDNMDYATVSVAIRSLEQLTDAAA